MGFADDKAGSSLPAHSSPGYAGHSASAAWVTRGAVQLMVFCGEPAIQSDPTMLQIPSLEQQMQSSVSSELNPLSPGCRRA